MNDQQVASRRAVMSSRRLEAFSDGVFAIAITLLVLDLAVPPREGSPDGSLGGALAHQWPSYFAYLVSFLIVGIIWVNHHTVFDKVRLVDRPVLFANLALLLFVSVLPFPTHLMAEYLTAGADSHIAAAVYSATMFAMGLAFVLLLRPAPHLPARRRLPGLTALAPNVPGSRSRVTTTGGPDGEERAPLRQPPQRGLLGAERRRESRGLEQAFLTIDVVTLVRRLPSMFQVYGKRIILVGPGRRSARSPSTRSARPTATTSAARSSASTRSRSSARSTWPTRRGWWHGSPARWRWCWRGH